MDTEYKAKLEALNKQVDVSSAQLDQLYEAVAQDGKIIAANQSFLIGSIRDLSLRHGIDPSRFPLREIPASISHLPKDTARLPLPIPQKAADRNASRTTVLRTDLDRVLKTYSEKVGFLAFSLLKSDGSHSDPNERLAVVVSDGIDIHSIELSFKFADRVLHFENVGELPVGGEDTWLLLFLFYSGDKDSKKKIIAFADHRQDLTVFSLKEYSVGEQHYWRRRREDLFNKTAHEGKCALVHGEIDAQEEYLIKIPFGSEICFLRYSLLKGGFSGSKVLLVSPIVSIGDNRKYVLKIEAASEGKLRKELNNYKNYVEPFWGTQHITADWFETPKYHMIRYPFASNDTIAESSSFSNEYRSSKNPQHLKETVERVFKHKLLEKWRMESSRAAWKKNTYRAAFANTFDWDSTKSALVELLKENPSIAISIDSIETILSSEFEYLECINHGDLHSDNIQVQNEPPGPIFLIDFGETGRFPAGFDYASLEASVKFRLLDFSVDPNLILERDLSQIGNFESQIQIETSFSGQLEKALKCCSIIREKYLNDFTEQGKLEERKRQYHICLFALCLRQIKYPDLNRRYILMTLRSLIEVLV